MLTLTSIRHSWPEKAGFRLYRKHGHPDYSFVHFITGVEITLHGETIHAPAHTCLIYRPGTPHQFRSEQPFLNDWFHFTISEESLEDRLCLPTDTLMYPRQSDFITDIVREMEREFFAQKSGAEELINLKAKELFIKLSRALTDNSPLIPDDSVSQRLRHLRSEILRTLSHPWTVAEMASRISLSESRFYTVYRSLYGTSPMDDLIHARIEAASQALLSTDLSVSDISASLGYSNTTHFIRQFGRLTGTSPLQYRKEKVSKKFPVI